MNTQPKIGFACKWETTDQELKERLTCRSTTVRHAGGLSQADLFKKLESIVDHNLSAITALIAQTGSLPPLLRMCRLTSDILPLKTHAVAAKFWESREIMLKVERGLSAAGQLARDRNVRLSFHPGQFAVLNSVNDGTINNAITEIEMHAEQAAMLGASGWHDAGWAINIHGGSKAGGLDRLKDGIARLSQLARDLLTIENDEFSWNVQQLVDADLPVPIVIDVHHHWISEGTHLLPNSELADRVLEGWRGVRPKLHAALSIEELVPADQKQALPSLQACLAAKQTKSSLRAHSYDAWHPAINDYFRTWLPRFDLMFEGKAKQVGARQIAGDLVTLPTEQ